MNKLGVNIDHIATIRQARRTIEPDPLFAMMLCEQAGCHGITMHLREDRRHIQDNDVREVRRRIRTRLNLEMALVDEMVQFALEINPHAVCLVPENRAEVTTEGGLAVSGNENKMEKNIQDLLSAGIEVSLFIDPDKREVDAAKKLGVSHIELHTGNFANAKSVKEQNIQFKRIQEMSEYAIKSGLIVNAGHGLTYHNVSRLAALKTINEFNIGHSIVSRAVFTGLKEAVNDMLRLLQAHD